MFEPYPGPKLTEEEVLIELEKIQKLGWDVNSLGSNNFIIDAKPDQQILVTFNGIEWGITIRRSGFFISIARSLSDIESFKNNLKRAADDIGIDLGIEPPTDSYRINKGEPLSNKLKLLRLIGNRAITHIYDSYFDARSLVNLLDLNKLGLRFNESLHCITGADMKRKKRISLDLVKDFTSETNTNIILKTQEFNGHTRRFLLLNDDKVIILGGSLNNLNINETLREEDSKEDIELFEKDWSTAEDFK